MATPVKMIKNKLHKIYPVESFRDIVYRCAERYGRRTAFRLRDGEAERTVSFEELRDHYRYLCAALISMGYRGRRIAIVGKNSYLWALTYLAAASVGVAVPIDKELSEEDIANFITAAECAVVVADEPIADRLRGAEPELCGSLRLLTMTGGGADGLPRVLEDGSRIYGAGERIIDTMDVDAEGMSVLLFTSGTTGSAKGVCLSQKNICENIMSTAKTVRADGSDGVLSILPLHHTYECTLGFLMILYSGAHISFSEGVRHVTRELTEYSPTVLFVVPQILNVMLRRIRRETEKACPEKYKAYFKELSLREALKKLPLPLAAIVKHRIRASLGGKLRLFIVGAAAADADVIRDFLALGVTTLQGYGLTECSPLLAGNSDFVFNPESVGVAIPGVDLKIIDPNSDGIGEIAAKGGNVMLGYYRDEQATAAAFEDGYFRTGDLGRIDENGFVYITGRLKNVIVTSNGKNVYPEELETRIGSHEDVEEVLVVASTDRDGDVCVKAKIFPNLEKIKSVLGRLPSAEEIAVFVKRVVEDVNKKIPSYKQIKKIEILTEKLEKTTTQKIKRFGRNTQEQAESSDETTAQ